MAEEKENRQEMLLPWTSSLIELSEADGIDENLALVYHTMLQILIFEEDGKLHHVSSALMYVALNEMGIKSNLCAGVVETENGMRISGSWIEISGKIFDMSGYFIEEGPRRQPVFNSMDLDTREPTKSVYGVSGYHPWARDIQIMTGEKLAVMSVLSAEYAKDEQGEPKQAWNLLYLIFKAVNRLDLFPKESGNDVMQAIYNRYKDLSWTLKDKEKPLHENFMSDMQAYAEMMSKQYQKNTNKIKFLSETENQAVLKRITRKHPSDVIELSHENDKKLVAMWTKGMGIKEGQTHVLPSDIFFAHTIPLMDCRIIIETQSGEEVKLRTVIFDDYIKHIEDAQNGDMVEVGAMLIEDEDQNALITVLKVLKGENILFLATSHGYRGIKKEDRERIANVVTEESIIKLWFPCAQTWYGIQIALLHPIIKQVFSKPQRAAQTKSKPRKNAKKKKQTTVTYTKQHNMRSIDLDDYFYGQAQQTTAGQNLGTGTKIKRQALLWYVIGHWRNKGKPNQKFIQGFWKGALRNLKQDMPEPNRKREIAQEEPSED